MQTEWLIKAFILKFLVSTSDRVITQQNSELVCTDEELTKKTNNAQSTKNRKSLQREEKTKGNIYTDLNI